MAKIIGITAIMIVALTSEMAAADLTNVVGPIEQKFKRTQQQIAVRKARAKQQAQSQNAAIQLSTVSFASYMTSNMESQVDVKPEQTAFEPVKPVASEAAKPEGAVNETGQTVSRAPASEPTVDGGLSNSPGY